MRRRRERGRPTAGRSGAPPGGSALSARAGAFAVALLAAVASAEIFRLGFFADDFHFLDVARRVPFFQALGGQFGVYPWYRPLSRESFFALIALAGPAGSLLARTLSLAAVAACAWLLDRIGRPLVGARAARIGAILFATYEFTRFLAAWASGFQDLLGLLLVLASLDALLRGRTALALVAAGLAPFAKETSLVVFPLLALLVLLRGEARRRMRTLGAIGAVMAAVTAVHLLVRASWKSGGSTAHIAFEPARWQGVVGAILGGFVGRTPVLEPWAVAFAALTALAALAVLADRSIAGRPEGSARARLAFVALAALIGFLPLAAGQWLRVSASHAYYGFAAAPWIALLAGAALARVPPAPLVSLLVAGLAGWNVLALGYRAPDLGIQPGWNFRRWDWHEAVRLSAVSRRLAEDLRTELADRPESLVVCFTGLPAGTYFQTEDGPATRVSLGDPTVRSYWVNAAPYAAASGPASLLEFDPVSLHLRKLDPASQSLDALSAAAVAAGDPGSAAMFAAIAGPSGRRSTEMKFYRAAAVLLAEGAPGYVRELEREGLLDSLGARPHEIAQGLLGTMPALAERFEDVLRHPLDADRRVVLASAFANVGGWISGAVELRVAMALEPRPPAERLRLAELLERNRDLRGARRELERVASEAEGTEAGREARSRLADLDRRGAAEAARTPVRVLGRPIERGVPPRELVPPVAPSSPGESRDR